MLYVATLYMAPPPSLPEQPDWKECIRHTLAPLKLGAEREIEIADELAQHLEDRYQEMLARGASPAQAQRASLERAGKRRSNCLTRPSRGSNSRWRVTLVTSQRVAT